MLVLTIPALGFQPFLRDGIKINVATATAAAPQTFVLHILEGLSTEDGDFRLMSFEHQGAEHRTG